MIDQAQGLRALAHQSRGAYPHSEAVVARPRRAARTIAVTSGKGGVGKTNFSANLALLLAKAGQRVALLDADLGLANVHVVFGICPRLHLGHVIRGETSLSDVIVELPQGIGIIAGGSGISALANLAPLDVHRFIDGLAELDDRADILLIDTGAGLADNVMAFVLAADEVIVVTTPEPTAIADAYATIKVISRENPESDIKLVVNMARNAAEADATVERLRLVAKQFLDFELGVLGVILQDPLIPKAVRAQRPVALDHPDGVTAKALGRMVDVLGYRGGRPTGVRGLLNRMTRLLRPEHTSPDRTPLIR